MNTITQVECRGADAEHLLEKDKTVRPVITEWESSGFLSPTLKGRSVSCLFAKEFGCGAVCAAGQKELTKREHMPRCIMRHPL